MGVAHESPKWVTVGVASDEDTRALLLAVHERADPAAQVRASADAAVAFAESHPEAYRVSFGRERAGATAHGPAVSESSRPTAEGLRALQQAGRLDPDLDVDLAARAVLAMEVGTILWWLDDTARADRDGLVDTLARLHPATAASR